MLVDEERWSPWRALVATAVSAATTTVLALGLRQLLTGVPGRTAPPTSIEGAVAVAVTALGTVAGVALTAGCALMTLSALLGAAGHACRRLDAAAALLTPDAVRRVVAVTVSAGLALSATPTVAGAAEAEPAVAGAAEADLGWTVTPPGGPTTVLAAPAAGQGAHTGQVAHGAERVDEGSADSESPSDRQGPAASPAASAEAPPVTSYTVVAGDSLWHIAAAHLSPTAEAADIAAAWPRWYEANRSTVADPDLIHPGQVLLAPGTAPSSEEPS